MFVLFPASDVSLINFDGLSFPAQAARCRVQFAHRLAQTMLHEPCGFVSDFERAMQLMRADTLSYCWP